ncbi:TolC family protein, partial [Klebsiella pneumoniae]|uniref:TolC family protein n=1 Tax=Klebsiella pneumoniae TaxID=573 RepID=UPI00272F92FD
PADLLRRRPDVRAAEARLISAYARVGVAKADLLPRLSLSAALGSLIDAYVVMENGMRITGIQWACAGTGPAVAGWPATK